MSADHGEDMVADSVRAQAVEALTTARARGCRLPMVPFNMGVVRMDQQQWGAAVAELRAAAVADQALNLEPAEHVNGGNLYVGNHYTIPCSEICTLRNEKFHTEI